MIGKFAERRLALERRPSGLDPADRLRRDLSRRQGAGRQHQLSDGESQALACAGESGVICRITRSLWISSE